MLKSVTEISENTKIVRLEGRIDMSNANEFEKTMLNDLNGITQIELDLAGLTFIDSTGVGHLVSVIQTFHTKNISFNMNNIPAGIGQIFSIIGVHEVINSLYS